MLRAKQIGTLSNGARSFFLGGSRCNNAADGSSCTCPEDETCVSRRQSLRNGGALAQKPSETSARVGVFVSGDVAKVVGSQTAAVNQPSLLKQAMIAPRILGRSHPVSNVGAAVEAFEQEMARFAPGLTDQMLMAGVAAVNFLSDVVNSKFALSDGFGILNSGKTCMVDPSRISSIRSSHVKRINRENFSGVHPRQSAEAAVQWSSASNANGAKSKVGKAGPVKGANNGPHSRNGESFTAQNTPVDACDRRAIPQRTKACMNGFKADFSSNANANAGSQASEAGALGRVGNNRGFVRPPRDMKFQPGYDPSRRQSTINGNVVERVLHLLQGLKWGRAAEEALDNLGFSIDAYQANQILKQLQDHNVALGLFYWLKQKAGFKHDGHTYTTTVGILGRAKQFGAINKLLHEMVKEGCQPNVVTYNRLIHSYGRANYLKDAMNVFDRMQNAGCEPDRVTYCTLIDIHAKAGFLDVALRLYDRMQRAGLSPDTFTYSVMINCLGKAGHLASAHNLFCKMVNEGCVPNLVTYNIMLALQAKARNYETALGIYREMQNAGFQPDKVTYSIVMEVLGHCGYLEEAEAVFAEMRRKNWVPDEPVYGLLVDLWGKSGNIEKAWEWYQAMLDAGLQPNVPTCNSLLSAFLRVHRLSDAHDLLRGMVDLGLNPSLQTYTLLLSCCTEAQSPYDMGFCCKLMATTGHPAHTFLLSMPSAGPDGQNVRDHMARFLDLMHSEDREGKRGLVDAVVDFLHKSGLKEEASSVWEVAARRNVYPDAVREKGSSHWLINLHVMSDGTAVTALSRTLAWFRRELLASGACPARIDIVTGWGRRSRVTGTSLVRHAVQELLRMFGFPFFTENGNTGCFVGCGEPLNRWLLHSYVERMHLL